MRRPNRSRTEVGTLWLQDWLGCRRLEGALRRDALADRLPQDEQIIYTTTYADDGYDYERFVEVWHLIARTLQVDPQVLRPSDRLENLIVAPTWLSGITGYEGDLEDLWWEVVGLARTEWPNEIEAIDDYVRLMLPNPPGHGERR